MELDIIDKDGNRVPVRPTAILSAFDVERSGWDIVLKPRQVFFTTWELAHDIHYFLTHPGAQVVVVCQSDAEDIAIKELSRRIKVMLGTDEAAKADPEARRGLLGKHPTLGVREISLTSWAFGEARLSIRGAGASAKAAEKKHRGGTIHRLHITEISSFEFAEETMNALLDCVPKSNPNAEVVIESTPRGAAGLFYRFYQDAKRGASSFKAHFFRWLSHREYRTKLEPGEVIRATTPREREMVAKYKATAEQVKWYRAKVADKGNQELADQEYPMDEETCWLTMGRQFLDVERTKILLSESADPIRIEKLTSSVPDPAVRCELRVWKEPYLRDAYVIVADPSEGVTGGDPCAAAIYHRKTGEHVASIHGLWRTHEFAAVLDKIGRRYNTALIVVERVNHGHAVLNALLRLEIREDDENQRDPYPLIYHDDDDKPGWKTGQVPRATAMENFEQAHRSGQWKSPDRDALDEMQRFVVGPTGKPEAAKGAHDDRVLTHVIMWAILSRPMTGGVRSGKSSYRYADEGGRGVY